MEYINIDNIETNNTDNDIDNIETNNNNNNIILQLENDQLIIINNISHEGEIHTLLRSLTEEKLHQMLYNICTNLFDYYKKSINFQD